MTLKKILAVTVILWFQLYLLVALLGCAYSEGKLGINVIFGGGIIVIFGILLIKHFQGYVKKIEQWQGTVVFIAILSIMVVVPRYILNVNFSVLQESDYKNYFIVSQYLYRGEEVPAHEMLYIKEWASNQFIIEKIFSFSYYIFGDVGWKAPLYLNIYFTLGYVLVFYMVCKEILNRPLAFVSAFMLAIWPENIINSIYLLSEPMHMFFLFLGIAFWWYGIKYDRIWLWLLSGAFLRISQEIRATTLAFLVALIIVYVFYSDDKYKTRKMLYALAGYLGVGILYSMYLYRQIGEIATPGIGWPAYLGSCIDNWGSWSAQSYFSAQEMVKNSSLGEMQKILLKKAVENYQSYDLKTIVYLLMRKAQTIFGFGDGTVRDVKYLMQMRPEVIYGSIPSSIWAWCNLANWVYIIFIIGGGVGTLCSLFEIFKKKIIDVKAIAMMLPICGIMAMHCFIYVSPRYIYPTIPFFITLFFYNLDLISRNRGE